ncbi:MAG: tetratricopeptide repeat protein [Bacteroidota bacterium]
MRSPTFLLLLVVCLGGSLTRCAQRDLVTEGKKKLEAQAYTEAEELFSSELRGDPRDHEAYWGRAKARMEQLRYEEAIPDLDQAIQLIGESTPDTGRTLQGQYHFDRGLSHYALAHFPEAITDFQRCIDLKYQEAQAHAHLGVAQGNQGKPVEAVLSLNTAIAQTPDDHFARANRGYYNSLLGDNKTAIADFTAAIGLEPDDKTSYLNRGYTYIGMNDYAAAIQDFEKALEIDPEYQGAITYLGIALTNSGNPQAGATWLDRAIKKEPQNGTLFYYRGVARINSGDIPGGCADLQQAQSLGDSQGQSMQESYCQ